MQICRDKTIQFLTSTIHVCECVGLFGGTEVRTDAVPKALRGAQGPIFRLWHLHGTAALVHDDAYHMAVPITWQCGGRPCHQHGRQINFKRMANGTQNRQGAGRLPASVRSSLATGLQPMAPALRDLQPYVFTREGGEGAGFLKCFLKLADVCPKWSG